MSTETEVPAENEAPAAEAVEGAPSGEKPFADLSDAEKVDFLLGKTRRLEDAVKGKAKDPDVRALRQRVKDLEKYEATVKDLEEASRTEAEKAVRKAAQDGEKAGRDAALAEARKVYGSQLVAVKLDAAAGGKGMTAEQIRKAAGDLGRFLGDDGVDDDSLADFLSALPDKAPGAAQAPLAPGSFGGGRREQTKVSDYERGRAESQELAERRRRTAAR